MMDSFRLPETSGPLTASVLDRDRMCSSQADTGNFAKVYVCRAVGQLHICVMLHFSSQQVTCQ